ncbi:MAG: protocatechuate 3,4-dioxygenase subunit beta, partial [Jatrophihabitantaceae bacterium]
MTELASQAQISAEIAAHAADWAADTGRNGEPISAPRLDYPPYRSSILRHPSHRLQPVDPEAAELLAPVFGVADLDPADADLTAQHAGEPIGERIVLAGRVLDASGRPVAGQLVEIWQANAAGRYRHQRDQHPAPI